LESPPKIYSYLPRRSGKKHRRSPMISGRKKRRIHIQLDYNKTRRKFPYLIRKIVIKERNFFNPFDKDFMKNKRIVIIL